MAIQSKQVRIILAADDPSLREQLTQALARDHPSLCILDSSFALRHFPISDTDFIILETKDDIAALVQTVYELYKATGVRDYTLPIMAIASDAAIRHNPALALWLTDNHAALMGLVPKEDLDLERLPNRLKLLFSD